MELLEFKSVSCLLKKSSFHVKYLKQCLKQSLYSNYWKFDFKITMGSILPYFKAYSVSDFQKSFSFSLIEFQFESDSNSLYFIQKILVFFSWVVFPTKSFQIHSQLIQMMSRVKKLRQQLISNQILDSEQQNDCSLTFFLLIYATVFL